MNATIVKQQIRIYFVEFGRNLNEMPVVVGEELTSTGILCLLYIIKLKCKVLIDILHEQ